MTVYWSQILQVCKPKVGQKWDETPFPTLVRS
jgi:hypothetical protein